MLSEDLKRDYLKLPSLEQDKRSENAAFKIFLKKYSSQEIDTIVLPIAELITKNIDCTQCGNCCRHLEPGITDEEAGNLALHKGMSKEIFMRDFTQTEAGSETLFM